MKKDSAAEGSPSCENGIVTGTGNLAAVAGIAETGEIIAASLKSVVAVPRRRVG